MSFTPIKDVLIKTGQPQFAKKPVDFSHFFDILREILLEELGPTVCANLHPLFLKNGAVCILSLHRASADILRLKENEIVDKLNSSLTGIVIRGLRLVG